MMDYILYPGRPNPAVLQATTPNNTHWRDLFQVTLDKFRVKESAQSCPRVSEEMIIDLKLFYLFPIHKNLKIFLILHNHVEWS